MVVNGIITAAGLSSRMQAFKPLLELNGKTVIEYSVDSMLTAGVSQVVVVLGYRGEEVEALLHAKYDVSRVLCVYNSLYAETDMLASVKNGIAALPSCDAFYLLPGDMPAVNKDTFAALEEALSRTQAAVAFPVFDGRRGHPPLISWGCKAFILKSGGEGGLREILSQLEGRVSEVSVEDPGCLMDADTREDYDRLVSYIAGTQPLII